MDSERKSQARVIRMSLEAALVEAKALLAIGQVVTNEALADEDGYRPFPGVTERMMERLSFAAECDDTVDEDTLLRWAGEETRIWFEGFPNDSRQNRANFLKTLMDDLAKEQAKDRA